MFSMFRRAVLQAWRMLNAMAESPDPVISLWEHQERRIAHLEQRLGRLESPAEE